jgi:hypothetical protein
MSSFFAIYLQGIIPPWEMVNRCFFKEINGPSQYRLRTLLDITMLFPSGEWLGQRYFSLPLAVMLVGYSRFVSAFWQMRNKK